MPLASTIFDEARFLLNDIGAKLYNNTILLPPLNKAYRELQQELVDNGISVNRIQTGEITVAAATIFITFGDPDFPTNLLYPIMLHEKLVGQDDINYIRMTETTWELDTTPTTYRNFWNWREDSINFPAATGDTIIRIRFWGGYEPLVDETSETFIRDSETFLASRTAALAAGYIGASPQKALPLQNDAEKALANLLSTSVKNRQALPVRRRAFRSFRRTWLNWR